MRKMEDPDVLSQALAEPTRRAILEQLRLGQKAVSELVEATGRKQPNVSNHLAKMRRQGLVRPERIGRQIYYSIATPFVDLLLRLHEYTADPMFDSGAEAGETPYATQLGTPPRNGRGLRNKAEEADAAPHHAEAARHAAEAANSSNGHGGEGREQSVSPGLSAWREAYCHSILEGQEDRAMTLVNAMLSRRLSLETIYIGVFQWSLNHIGVLYQNGETDEAREHIASSITERMMAKVAQFYSPVSRAARRALIGCVAGNWHTLGLRMLSDGLRGLGWDALFLGANTPANSILNLIPTVKPDLVVLSCAMEDQWPETEELVKRLAALRESEPSYQFLVALGGHFVMTHPELLAPLPVDFSANDLSQFLNEVRRRYYLGTETAAVLASERA